MKYLNKIQPVLFGGATILLANLFHQDDWGFILSLAIIFVIGGLTLPSLIRFMSDNKKDTFCK